jgi:hypothetical protein
LTRFSFVGHVQADVFVISPPFAFGSGWGTRLEKAIGGWGKWCIAWILRPLASE